MLLRLPISSPLCHVCQRCHGVNGFYEIRGVATVEIIREIQEDLYIYFINKPVKNMSMGLQKMCTKSYFEDLPPENTSGGRQIFRRRFENILEGVGNVVIYRSEF